MPETRKLYIETYGCQMNVYDSEKMAALLKPHGFEVSTEEVADVMVLNTCHIREKAAEKVYSKIGKWAKYKKRRKEDGIETIIIVTGCVAQAEGKEIIARAPSVDLVLGPQSYHSLPELVTKINRQAQQRVHLNFTPHDKFDAINKTDLRNNKVSAFLSIQEGCDQFCHFCVVPYTRGPQYSRKVEEIYREALMYAGNGCAELTLLGQNVSSYCGQDQDGNVYTLGRLVDLLSHIPQIKRIRYTTSHPVDMEDSELLESHANNSKLMPYLHLPIQSGSNRILKAMNRKHDRDFYLSIIDKFKKASPNMNFSSDFIVGYPGETEQDFEDTLDIIRHVEYGGPCFSFAYSIRPGTPAAVMTNQVPEDEKKRRLLILQSELAKYQLKHNQSMAGRVLTVLFEKSGKHPGQIMGKSPYMQSVVVQDASSNLIGSMQDVYIIAGYQNSLLGSIHANQD